MSHLPRECFWCGWKCEGNCHGAWGPCSYEIHEWDQKSIVLCSVCAMERKGVRHHQETYRPDMTGKMGSIRPFDDDAGKAVAS